MARKKRLNVLNSQKIFNLNIVPRDYSYVPVTPDNYNDIFKELELFSKEQDPIIKNRNGIKYIVYYDKLYDFSFYKYLVELSDSFLLVTDDIIPVTLIDLLSSYPRIVQARYIFNSEFTDGIIENIIQTSAGIKVSILYNTDSDSSFSLKRGLYPLKYSANEVIIRWESTNYENEYSFFTGIRNALSGWGIVITIEYNTIEERDYLLKRKKEDAEIKQSSYVWGRE